VVDQLKAEYNIEVEWKPFYLRPNTPPEGMELPDYIKQAQANGADERLKAMAGLHGMEFKSPTRYHNTRLAHEATEYARERGKGNEFHKAMFAKVYAQAQDPSKWDVLRAVADEVGLDADEMQKDVEGDKYKENVWDQVKWAAQIGVSVVPTYVINDKYAIVGAQPYENFKSALGKILSGNA